MIYGNVTSRHIERRPGWLRQRARRVLSPLDSRRVGARFSSQANTSYSDRKYRTSFIYERSIDSRSRSTAIVYLPKHRSVGIARTREILHRSIVRLPRGFDKRAIVSLLVCQTRLRNAGSWPRFYRNQPCHASPRLRLGKCTTYARRCVAFVTP